MLKIPDKIRIQELSEKWLNGNLTQLEQEEYDRWYGSFEDGLVEDFSEIEFDALGNRIYQRIQQKEEFGLPSSKIKKFPKLKQVLMVAASISFVFLAAALFYHSNLQKKKEKQEAFYAAISPGRDRAVLSLDNGTVFDLDSLKKGEVFQGSGVRIEKNEEGELVYSALPSSGTQKDVLMSTILTPNGGQYKINLPDGSRVWLNASSQLTFPTAFVGEKRTVELKGEAYFEVTENKKQPFSVITEQEEVEVLGTHFNVNAYPEEESSTVSLLEGKVKVSVSPTDYSFLKPGQQSVVKTGSMKIFPVDVSEAIAWKNGEFMFNNENIKSVMAKVARWYDIEVILDPALENIAIWGSVSKYKNIKEVLKIIEMTGSVYFKIEGRRIYVMA